MADITIEDHFPELKKYLSVQLKRVEIKAGLV